MTNPSAPKKEGRPLALTLALIFIVLGALINIVAGASAIWLADVNGDGIISVAARDLEHDLDGLSEELDLALVGVWALVVGVVQLGISIGFAREKRWAWVAIMTWQALNLLVQVSATLAGGGEWLSLVFSIILVFMLNQNPVRRAFGIVRQQHEPSVTSLRTFDPN